MNIFGKKWEISASIIVVIVLIILLGVSIFIYVKIDDTNNIWGCLIGSFAAGIVIALIQFVISWNDYQETEKLKKLKLIKILYDRSDKSHYGDLIKSTNRELDIMGVTAVRFFRDFADMDCGAPERSKVLLRILEKGTRVRILLPNVDFIPKSKKTDFNEVCNKYKKLHEKYNTIEVRYFNHNPAHSIFRMDDECIVGPVFPKQESRNTPALHLRSSSPIADKYLDYFEKEWNQAKEIDNV